MNELDEKLDIETLLNSLHAHIGDLQRRLSMTEHAAQISPIQEAGRCIRAERKRQGLTLNALCDLSGVAYVTLIKIEKGAGNVRLDSLNSIADALGLKLWIG